MNLSIPSDPDIFHQLANVSIADHQTADEAPTRPLCVARSSPIQHPHCEAGNGEREREGGREGGWGA